MFEGVILCLLLFLSEDECQENCLKIKLWASCSSLLRVGSLTSLTCRTGVWFCTRRWRLLLFLCSSLTLGGFWSSGLRCWLFSVHFCGPESWGCHPDKTKISLQCKYLWDNFTWSFRDMSLHLLHQTPPSLPSLPLDEKQNIARHSDFKVQLGSKRWNCIWKKLFLGHKQREKCMCGFCFYLKPTAGVKDLFVQLFFWVFLFLCFSAG